MDNYGQFKDAVMGANNIKAPETVGGNDPLIQNLYNGAFQGIMSNAGAKAIGGQSVVDKQAQDAAAANALQQAKLSQQKLIDKTDPKKWTLQRKSDGGYDIFDPDGNKSNVNQMAQLTNTDPMDILKGSQNPHDIQYLQDYADLTDLLKAHAQHDTEAIKAAVQEQPALAGMTPEELMRRFRDAYPHVYGGQGAGTGTRNVSQRSLFGAATSQPTGDSLAAQLGIGG